MNKSQNQVKELLDQYVDQINRPQFIDADPICIPHRYSNRQDIEIAGFFAATFSWGQRKTIINKSTELMALMDNCPYDFIVNHQPKDRRRFERFVHRTFQYTDTIYFLTFLQNHYRQHNTLETLFLNDTGSSPDLEIFHDRFFEHPDAPARTRKHVPTPRRNSTCKRINMFLRWMVRRDHRGVDFGIWKHLSPSQLMIPLDLHVDRVARKLKLLERKQTDWKATLELTGNLRRLNPEDPIKYDFALFGLGVLGKEIFLA